MPDPSSISRFRKERYIREMSEDVFRDTVVRPLFLRLGHNDGRDLCGPAEAGKDAIFTEVDRFGLTSVIAVQTKKGNLNLSATASKNIIAAITQLNTALATSITLLAPKQHVRPQKAYLCVSGRINDAARDHILKEVSTPNITFLDADDLIPKIDESIPEVWLGIDVSLIPYFDALRRLVEGAAAAGSAASSEGSTGVFSVAASDAKFVALTLNRSVTRTRTEHGQVSRYTDIEEFPLTAAVGKKDRRILIIGEAGSGKSTGLLRIAYTMAKAGIADGGMYKVPVLLRSLEVHERQPSNLAEYCHLACQELTGRDSPCFTSDDLVSGRVVLLLDSLDELPTDDARSNVLSLVEDMLVSYPLVQVISTSRPYAFTGRLPQLNHYAEYRISPISWNQANKILRAVKSGDRLTKNQSQELLRKLEKIHGIELNPLLVTVFAATTDIAKQDIPANITELFKKFTELMLGRWDEAKGLRQQYQAPLKDFVLTKLAFSMHSQNRTSLSREDAESLVRRELLVRGHEEDAGTLLDETFERSGLFRIVEDNVEFRHLLLQEFFAGRGIESVDQVKQFVSQEWWKRALVFYFGDNPQRIDVLRESMSSILANADARLAAASTVGLALQACYLSPVVEKLAVWRWVNNTVSGAMEHFIRSIEPEGRLPTLSFVHYYLYARDATALSNLRGHMSELIEWCSQDEGTEPFHPERRTFWLISGLIESGDLETAENLIKKFRPTDLRLLLALNLGAFFTAKIRPVSQRDKRIAMDIVMRLDEPISGLRAELTKEFDSVLLEMRNGRPTAIEHEIIPDHRESET
jgi:hypothetical protein